MMVVGLLPLSSINVSAQESELIINDSEVGQELHQFNYQGNWGTSEGYPDRFYGGDEHWFNFQRYTQGVNPVLDQVMKLNSKELVLNYMVKNNLN